MTERAHADQGAVAVLCPSLGKACGIARYATYVADSLSKAGLSVSLIRRSAELFRREAPHIQTVIVQHEYGLFDGLAPLGTGETTSELLAGLARYEAAHPGARTAIVMHTVATHDHVLNVMNSQIFSSSIPVFHLNSKGCYDLGIPYLEHGVYAYRRQERERPAWIDGEEEIPRVMGSFGLLSPNKRPTQLIDICARSGSDFLGNFATSDRALVQTVVQGARAAGVKAEIHSDFCSEAELLARLEGATFAAVAQEGIAHSATSGSLRFLFNLGIPVLAPFVSQFADCEDGVIFAHPDRMHGTIQTLTSDRGLYREAVERAVRFLERNEMGAVYGRLLNLLHETPNRELVTYRKRNFRELNPDAPLLTLADLCIRSLGTQEPGGEDAAEKTLVGALASDDSGATASILAGVPATGPVELRIGLDRVASPLMQARERAVLIGSERFIGRNLRKLGEHLAVNDTIEVKAREELIRLVRAAAEKSELLERREAIRLLAGTSLHALRPDLYPADIGTVADRLRALTVHYSNERGFAGRTRAVASVPVLIALPAEQMFSYLFRVARLSAAEILALVGSLGLPNDRLSDRADWVRGLEKAYPRRSGTDLSSWRPDPRDLRGRTRFFRTELACLTDPEFALAMGEVFQLQTVPGAELDQLKRTLPRDGRRAALQHLIASVAGIYGIAVVDLHETAPNLLDRVDRIEGYYKPPDDMLRLFLDPPHFEYLNRAEKAEELDWLAEVGPNDLFAPRVAGEASTEPVYLVPAPLEAGLSALAPTPALRREAWSVETQDGGWSYYRRPAQPGVEPSAALPDRKWEEAWNAVARHPVGKAIGPEEMRAVSGRVVPMHIAVGITDVDFLVLHKGRQFEYERFLADMTPQEWHVSFANDVFIVFARRVHPVEAFSPDDVPERFQPYLKVASVRLSKLLGRIGRRARIG